MRVSVDGQDATEGVWLIVDGKSPLELKRFIKNGNMNRGNAFKFIERTAQIEEHRGIGAEDGLITIEYKFEQPINQQIYPSGYLLTKSDYSGIGQNHQYPVNTITSHNVQTRELRSTPTFNAATKGKSPEKITRSNSMNWTETSFRDSFNDAGITVAGSECDQQFTQGSWFPTEVASHTLVLKLVGKVAGKPVVKPVTVNYKPTCTTCGRVNRAINKFCAQCGTSLVLL